MQYASKSVGVGIGLQHRAPPLQRSDRHTLDLLEVKARRCERAYAALYAYFSPRLSAFLRQKGASLRISQEVSQDVMARVWEKAHLFNDKEANASTWIYAIARNRFIDVVRKERRSEVDMNDPLLVQDSAPAPDDALHRSDASKGLKVALTALPEAQLEVLTLVYLQGLKQQAVADQLGVPVNTVKSRLRIALEKLRREMENA